MWKQYNRLSRPPKTRKEKQLPKTSQNWTRNSTLKFKKWSFFDLCFHLNPNNKGRKNKGRNSNTVGSGTKLRRKPLVPARCIKTRRKGSSQHFKYVFKSSQLRLEKKLFTAAWEQNQQKTRKIAEKHHFLEFWSRRNFFSVGVADSVRATGGLVC